MATKKKVLTEEERLKKKATELSRQTGFVKTNGKLSAAKTQQTNLLDYLAKRFEIRFFTNSFCMKLVRINEGTYKGLVSPIGYGQLLDMYKYYDREIENSIVYLKSKNPTVTRDSILNYCLSVVLNKLNDYQQLLDSKEEVDYNYDANKIYEIKNNQIDVTRKETRKQTVDLASFLDEEF